MAYIVGIDRYQTRIVTSSLDDLIDENNSVRVIFVRYAIEFLIIIRICINLMTSPPGTSASIFNTSFIKHQFPKQIF